MVPYQDKETLIAAMKKYKTLKTIATSFQTNEDTIKKWAYHFGVQNLIGSQGARRHKINDSFFDVIDTEHKAYWLGFLMADKKFKYLIYKDATIYLDRKFKKFNCPA